MNTTLIYFKKVHDDTLFCSDGIMLSKIAETGLLSPQNTDQQYIENNYLSELPDLITEEIFFIQFKNKTNEGNTLLQKKPLAIERFRNLIPIAKEEEVSFETIGIIPNDFKELKAGMIAYERQNQWVTILCVIPEFKINVDSFTFSYPPAASYSVRKSEIRSRMAMAQVDGDTIFGAIETAGSFIGFALVLNPATAPIGLLIMGALAVVQIFKSFLPQPEGENPLKVMSEILIRKIEQLNMERMQSVFEAANDSWTNFYNTVSDSDMKISEDEAQAVIDNLRRELLSSDGLKSYVYNTMEPSYRTISFPIFLYGAILHLAMQKTLLYIDYISYLIQLPKGVDKDSDNSYFKKMMLYKDNLDHFTKYIAYADGLIKDADKELSDRLAKVSDIQKGPNETYCTSMKCDTTPGPYFFYDDEVKNQFYAQAAKCGESEEQKDKEAHDQATDKRTQIINDITKTHNENYYYGDHKDDCVKQVKMMKDGLAALKK